MSLNQAAKNQLRNMRKPALLSLSLVVTTLGLMLWHQFGMNRSFVIYPNPEVNTYPVSDRSSGGASLATVQKDGDALRLNCTIVKAIEWPYCQFNLETGDSYTESVQGTHYDSLFIDVEILSSQSESEMRVLLYSYDPAFSQADRFETLMPTQIQYFPDRYPDGLMIGLDRFRTATWWLNRQDLPILQQTTDFDHIPMIQVASRPHVQEGQHQYRLNELSLHGKWISAELLYSGLLGVWMLHSAYWLLHYLLQVRTQLDLERGRRRDLEKLNVVLELSQQRLQNQALRDELTGLYNRRGLRDRLYDAMREAEDANQDLSVIFIDIDRFKPVNDTHGHDTGDAILKEFAHCLGQAIRGQDTLIRWGGEEFLILCPQTDATRAHALSEKLRRRIEVHHWPHHEPLTSSFGVAQLHGDDASDMIRRADQALYRAKSSGRNRVAVDDQDAEQSGQRDATDAAVEPTDHLQ